MPTRLRVFLLGESEADLRALAARVEENGLMEVAGRALISDVQQGVARVPSDVDALLTAPATLVPPQPAARASVSPMLVEQLTPRETAVLALVADGLPNKEIAHALGISEHTVKFHLAAVFGKLAASSRTEAVRRGLELGLIEI